MAQQNVEFNIGANVTGMEAIASLINKTDALGKSQKDLATAFEKMSGAAKKASDVQKAALQIDAARQEVSARAAQAFFAEAHAIDKVSKSARDSASVFEEMFRQQDQVSASQREAAAAADALRAKLDPMVPLQRQFNAAMDQADNLLSMGAINQREYAQAVELARQNLQEQTAAFHASGAAQNGVIVNGVRYNNMTDAQSKALRNHRQGVQMLGMQFNDLATSVSTGASPLQAFNQQLGQIGYSMSMMEGRLGKVGAFLAGPWGAAILMATMGLGYLAEKFLFTEEASKKAEKANYDFSQAVDFSAISVNEFGSALEQLNARTRAAISVQMSLTTALFQNAKMAQIEAKRRLDQSLENQSAVQKEQGTWKQWIPFLRTSAREVSSIREEWLAASKAAAIADNSFAAASAAIMQRNVKESLDPRAKATREYEDAVGRLNQKFLESDPLLRMSNAQYEEQHRNLIKNHEATLKLLDAEKKTGGSSRGGGGASALRAVEAAAKKEQEIADALTRHKIMAEMQWQKTWEDLQEKHDIKMMDRSSALQEQLQVQAEMNRTLFIEPVNAGLEELARSYDNIGNSVAGAFKGMLTGASSWQDGMKGIINSVIDELWRLYVVQQIVGLIGGALKGIGLPTPVIAGARANGGHVSGNKPYLVGENGPELMVPGGSGTIIPNRNMGMGGTGGSGMTINVDARGSNDPAAVRAQVQQGILEAAPAIIAAAEARTVQGMRRPRLGGAMQ